MPKIAVLAAPDSWYARDLLRAAEGRCEVVIVPFSTIAARLGDAPLHLWSGEQALGPCDALLVRTMPPGSLEQVVFRMDCLLRFEAAGGVVLNPPRAVEASVDKFLTSAKLAAAGLRSPRTIVCQTADDGLKAFAELGGDIVLKPLFGSEGRGIARIQDEALALRAFRLLEQLGAVLYIQQFVPHAGCDWRLFVLGNSVYGMTRTSQGDWRTNVSRGASAAPLPVTDELRELALRAAQAVGAPLAGVDFLPGDDGRLYAIEVNAVPGWKALAKTLQIDIAAQVIDFTLAEVAARRDGGATTGSARAWWRRGVSS